MIQRRIILTHNNNLMLTFSVKPGDMDILSADAQDGAEARLNRMLMRLGQRWSIWTECQRRPSYYYPESAWPDPVSRLIDHQRRQIFTAPGNQLSSHYFMTLLYAPRSFTAGKVSAIYGSDAAAGANDVAIASGELQTFIATCEEVEGYLAERSISCEVLTGDALTSYLRSCVSTQYVDVRTPPLGDLDARWLLQDDFVPGYDPRLGDCHIRTIKIKSHGIGLFRVLNNLRFPARIVSLYQPLDTADARAEIALRQTIWHSSVESIKSHILRQLSGSKTTVRDESRDNATAELSELSAKDALVALDKGEIGFGYWVFTVTVWDRDMDALNERVNFIDRLVNDAGFTSKVAIGLDSMPVWLGTIPGHPGSDLQKLLSPTTNVARTMPLSEEWNGTPWDEKLNGPPVHRCLSYSPNHLVGGSAFDLTLHQRGSTVGHILFDAITGAGKSFGCGEIIAGFRKYPGSQIFIIDYLGSQKGITLALGGSYRDLGKARMQPLADVDQPSERAWAFGWIIGCAQQEGASITPSVKTEIGIALGILGDNERRWRTLSSFCSVVQVPELWEVLKPFCGDGPAGRILDSDEAVLGNEHIVCYEMGGLLEHNRIALNPVISAMQHEIQRRLRGRPTLLVIDECQVHVRNPMFRAGLQQWLETMRKLNCSVILVTPDITAFTESDDLIEVVKRSCQTQIFGANPGATTDTSRVAYKRIGVPYAHIDIIADLEKAREYFARTWNGSRRFEFAATPVEVAFLGRNTPRDLRAMDEVMAAGPAHEYPWRWLAREGFSDEQIAAMRAEVDQPIMMAAE